MKHIPRKRFGQNFLQNQHIIDDILRSLNLQVADKVLEIGPGLGALTRPLLERLPRLTAVEIDTDLQKHLLNLPKAKGRLELIAGDALSLDYGQFGPKLRVVGNLPYNISTPLLIHLVHFVPFIEDMHFMLQKEVAQRLAASPGTKNYGRLTLRVQYHCEVEYLLDVPPQAFDPQPKVDSAWVRLIPYPVSPFDPVALDQLERLIASAFAMRRKTLNNNLKGILPVAQLAVLGIDGSKRPEQIPLVDYVRMAKFVSS